MHDYCRIVQLCIVLSAVPGAVALQPPPTPPTVAVPPAGAGTGLSGITPIASSSVAVPAPMPQQPQQSSVPNTASKTIKVPANPAVQFEAGFDKTYTAEVDVVLSSVPPENLLHHVVSLDGASTVDEPDEKRYMANRIVYDTTLEEVFGTTPFETYQLQRCAL